MLDRGSRESKLSDTFATRIRLISLGSVPLCKLDSDMWLLDEVSKIDGKPSIHVFGEGAVNDILLSNL